MVDTLNVIVNAVSISSLYAIIAIGFTLIFGVGGVLNFGHGGLITLGGFTGYLLSTQLGMSPWLAILVSVLVGGVAGAIMYLGLIRYIEDRPVIVLILTLIIGYFIQHTLRIFVESGTITIPLPVSGSVQILGQAIQNISFLVFFSSWTVIIGIYLFVNYTDTGRALIATSMSEKGANLVGINSNRINLYTWSLAAGLAGLAGVFLTMMQTGAYDMGIEPLVLSFSIVILGGLGSIRGSIVGAYIVGFTETITVSYVSSKLTGLSALILLVAFLLIKPEGLFGREVAE